VTSEKQILANRQNAQKSTGPRTPEGKAIVARNAVKHGLLSRLEVLPGLERAEDWKGHYGAVLGDLRPEGYLQEVLAERIAFLLWRLGRVARYEREVSAVALENAEKEMGREHYDKVGPLPNARLEAQKAREYQDFVNGLGKLPEDERIDAGIATNLLEKTAEAANVDLYSEDLNFPGYPDGRKLEDGTELEDVEWTAGYLRDCLGVVAEAGGGTLREMREALIAVAADRLRFAEKKVKDLERDLDQYRRQKILPDGPELEKVNRYETATERSLYRALHELQRLQASRSADKVSPPAVLDVNVSQDGS